MSKKTLAYGALFVGLLFVIITFFSHILAYVVMAIILATLLRPVVNLLYRLRFFRKHLYRSIAVLLSFIAPLLILYLLMLLFFPLVNEQAAMIANLDYETVMKTISPPILWTENFMIRHHLTDDAPGFLIQATKGSILSFVKSIDLSDVLSEFLSLTGSFFIALIATLFITFFLLLSEERVLDRYLLALVPNRYFEVTAHAIFTIEKRLVSYLWGLLFQILSIFTVASMGLFIVGVEYAFTIAAFAALANIVPYLGPLMGTVFGIVIALSAQSMPFSYDALLFVLRIAAVFAGVQILDNVLFQPLIFSRSTRAHPLEIFIIVFVGATLAGVLGMLVAIPLYTVLKVSCLELYKGTKNYKVFNMPPWG